MGGFFQIIILDWQKTKSQHGQPILPEGQIQDQGNKLKVSYNKYQSVLGYLMAETCLILNAFSDML